MAVLWLFIAVPAYANPAVTFTFNGLSNNEHVLNYFSGGYGSLGSGAGPNYDITFSPNALIVSGAQGNLLAGNGTIVMNVYTEFANGFQFSYVALAPEVVNVWSGYDGTGSLLATMTLVPNAACNSLTKCGWAHAGESFPGVGASVTFTAADGQFGIGSMKIGATSAMATPEPSSLILVPTGLAGLMWIYIRRKKMAAPAMV